MEISGRIAVVTGGAKGIGKCYVEFLLKNGAKVRVPAVPDFKKKLISEIVIIFIN